MRTIHIATTIVLTAAMIAAAPGTGLGGPKRLIDRYTSVPATRVVPGPTVAYAGTTLECGSKSYHVTTGSNAGKCEAILKPDGITQIGVACKDGKGNYAGATCGEGCLSSSQGSGDCTKQ